MHIITKRTLLFLALIVGLSACVSSKKYDALEEEKMNLESELSTMQEDYNEMKEEKMALESDKASLEKKVSMLEKDMASQKMELSETKEENSELSSELKKIKMELSASFAAANNSGVELTSRDGRLHISLPNQILYSPGSADISYKGRKVLDSLSSVFQNNTDLNVLVEGHTDKDPINKSADQYTDNWDLSMQRSVKVVRELIKRGVDGDQLTAAGRAMFSPLVEKPSTYEEKMKNRRTEFVIYPKTANLHQFSK